VQDIMLEELGKFKDPI